MEILIRSTPAEVAVEAADIFAHYANAGATLGLATGSTPVAMYKELITRHERGEVSFARSRAFLLDEYIGLERELSTKAQPGEILAGLYSFRPNGGESVS